MTPLEFISITLTLFILIGFTFKMKVPMASFPLFIIYIFLLFIEYKPTEKIEANPIDLNNPLKEKEDSQLIKNKVIKKNEKKILKKEVSNLKEKEPIQKKEKIPSIIKEEKKTTGIIKKKENNLVLIDIKICKGIKNRRPIGFDTVFPNTVDSLYCYTKIQNLGQKKEAKHVWYYENQIMTQVRYNVKKSKSYRSWTKKTILPYQVGSWRVDVQNQNGTIIGSKKFKINKSSNKN